MKTDVVHGFGGFFILIGFYLAGFVIVYKIVDIVFWLINGYWFGYQFYDFLRNYFNKIYRAVSNKKFKK